MRSPQLAGSILGAAVKRVEDPRFITGRGDYITNMEVKGAAWMVPVRSPISHGVVTGVDVDAARRMQGVVALVTALDLEGLRGVSVDRMPSDARGLPDATRRPLIAGDRVRFVGDIVAVVVAETRRQAVDAAAEVWSDIDPLPAVGSAEAALAAGAPLLYPEIGTNVVLEGGTGPVDGLFDDAEVVIGHRIVNQRLAAVPLEANAALAVPRDDGDLDLWVASQNVFAHRNAISTAIGLDRSTLHVKVPDMGGGFGAKIVPYPEQALVAALALHLGRPVRWHEDRVENLQAMTHGRAHTQQVELGARSDGTLTGLRVSAVQEAGAYPLFGANLPSFTHRMAAGPYSIPRVEFNWRSVVTNTTPVHAYRGAGRPEAMNSLERMIDLLGRRLDIDPVEIRRRNFPPPDAFPVESATGERYDSGDYAGALDLALKVAGYDELREEQRNRRRRGGGVQLGIGVASYVEVTAPGGRKEWGRVSVNPDGSVVAHSGSSSHGQGHETTFAQIVARALSVPIERVHVVQGDTDSVVRGTGTMGSRSMQLGGTAVRRSADSVLHKARRLVAHLFEASLDDVVVFEDGRIGVAGVPDTGRTLAEIARLAADPANLPDGEEAGLSAEETITQDEATVPFGSHVSVVDVDTETGDVRIRRHIACDDCGVIFNRLVVDGQVHGGVAQGAGQALYEQFLYGDDGDPLTPNLTSYLIPTATTLPSLEVDHTETPTDQNPLGAKGIGESGTIGSTPAIVNAVHDALAPYGIEHLDMPLTPVKIWDAIRRVPGS